MKTNYFVIAALAATTLFASCDKNNDGIDVIDEGKTTSMKVSINFPRAETRATSDLNATQNEAEVKTVDVFIYYTNSGAFGTHKHLAAGDFTEASSNGTADIYTVNSKIQTTTGAKSVFAGINLPQTVVDALKNKPMSELISTAQTMSRTEMAGSTTGFVMFSTEAVNAVFVESETDPANSITLRCQRLVAKVTVETSETLDVAGVPGTLGNLQFAISNFNTKLFLLQGEAPLHKDPNWSKDVYDANPIAAAADFNNDLVYANIWNCKDNGAPKISDYSPLYAAENTSEAKRKKEISRATVRATFIPRDITEGTTGNFTVNDGHGITSPQTFYAVTPSVEAGTSYFFSSTIAGAFATEKGGTVVTYTGGYCYWDIFLNKNAPNALNRWDVLRNDFYKCNITRIVAPGRNTPDVPDPEVTPDVETNITADIQILFWHTPIESNYILE